MRYVLLLLIAQPVSLFADDDQKVAYFEKHIRPVLSSHCYECHSAKSKSVKGGLLLDSRQGLLEGGDSGAALVPGKPAESLLLSALRYETLEMPPKRRLDAAVVDKFERWIRDGAVDPRAAKKAGGEKGIDWAEARQFWAFQPLRSGPAPAVQRGDWANNSVDLFILHRLEEAGLKPQPQADRLTLLRRACFDLVGLPPTPQQVGDFLADESPQAYERLIDRLLASPRYGERWGRHWLDVVRYADSNGSDENHNLPNAWRYRDYVIGSYNDDVPYDRFVTEQLAGDLLPADEDAERFRLWTATGYLVLGSKMLAEQDKEKMLADIVDEQVDSTSQAFLGMTVGCARCHDHKFDPIPTADYYALAGIFHSTKSMANQDFVSKWNERYLVDAETRKRIAEQLASVQQLTKRRDQLRDRLNESSKLTEKRARIAVEKKSVEKQIKKLEAEILEYPSAMAVESAAARDVAIHIRGSHLSLAPKTTPRGFLSVTQEVLSPPPIPTQSSGRLELARWLTDPANPLTARVMANRIWQGHFGVGLTGSSNNFGVRGQRPTHPRLLDWLAGEFIRNRWSVKHMHRLIMTSASYKMGSRHDEASAAIDPSNQLLWRQRRTRLEVEPIRDSILAVGGALDLKIGGSISGDETPGYQRLKKDVFGSTRRAVYLPINRSALYEMFSIFDYADASASLGRRPTTTVSHQALFMLNSPLVLTQTRSLATRLLNTVEDPPDRLSRLYITLYGRQPTEDESAAAMDFLEQAARISATKDQNAELESWISLCRVLMAANEFVYID